MCQQVCSQTETCFLVLDKKNKCVSEQKWLAAKLRLTNKGSVSNPYLITLGQHSTKQNLNHIHHKTVLSPQGVSLCQVIHLYVLLWLDISEFFF